MIDFSLPAYRWIEKNSLQSLVPVVLPDELLSTKLLGIDDELKLVYKNITFFTQSKRALNILLWGEKGAGKSTVIRMLARDFFDEGLRILEFCSSDYYSIYGLYEIIRSSPELFFLIYFDDVSFDNSDSKYRSFKSIVEGGLEERPRNSLFVATSNRRHLITEKASRTTDIYSRDDQNETSSLYARFGLTLGFYPLTQELYLEIVEHYLKLNKVTLYDGWAQEAINFALDRGGQNGRVAQQFAIYKQISLTEIKW